MSTLPVAQAILSVNAGSSSLKFALYPVQGEQVGEALLTGNFEGLQPQGQPTLAWRWQGRAQQQTLSAGRADPFDAALQELQRVLQSTPGLPALQAVAHRVVHGGEQHTRAVLAKIGRAHV